MKMPVNVSPDFILKDVESRHSELSQDFFHKIVGIDRRQCILTDASGLDEFDGAFGRSTEDRLKEIYALYGVQLTKDHDLTFVAIFNLIVAAKRPPEP